MMLKAILRAQHFCGFVSMLFIVNLLIRTDSTVICVPCMPEHVCYEPFSLQNYRFERYLIRYSHQNLRCLKSGIDYS